MALEDKYEFPEENVKPKDDTKQTLFGKVSNLSQRLVEYLILIGTASVIIYVVFKQIFGSPAKLQSDITATVQNTDYMRNKMDTMVESQNYLYQEIVDSKDSLDGRITEGNYLLKSTNAKLDRVIRLLKEQNRLQNQSQIKPKPTQPTQTQSYDKIMNDYFKQRKINSTLVPQKKN